MSFVSYSFGLLFLAIFFVRMALDPVRHKGAYLAAVIVASFVFYAWLVPAYVLVLLTTSGVDYLAAARMPALAPGSGGRKALLVVSLAVNLGMLAFFKYFDFAAGNVVALLQTFGLRLSPPHLELALPLGISFYTFESMSYTIDVYRDRIQPVRRLRDYVLFIGFFPHLVAGPIVRARDFLYQIERTRRPRLRVVTYGAYLMIRGFFLKLVVADNLATIVDTHWPRAGAENANASLTLAIAVMFGLQILCDFDGYTSIARGAAYILGFRLPVNFRAPYLAGTFRSFWQRWHITLSRWLRDYLYVPLGGNRGSRLRTYANLLTVMLLGGLWHGANYTFLAWGALHGFALAGERLLGLDDQRTRPRAVRIAWLLVVQAVVLVGWIFFRSASVDGALGILRKLVAGPYRPIEPLLLLQMSLFALPPIAGHVTAWVQERYGVRDRSLVGRGLLAATMLYATCVASGRNNAFIYFQF